MAAGNDTILRMNDVHASYGSVAVLCGVSLDIKRGEMAVLVGRHGSGKTAVLKAICGILPVSRGEVLFGGRPIQGMPLEKIVGLGVAYVDEMKLLFPAMTVIDNLILGAYHRHRSERREHIEQDIAEVYSLFPVLEERAKQYAGTLSGGEQQMLAIGRALMSRPELMLLDCPTLGLAPKLADKVVKALAELRDKGIAILLIDQKLKQVVDVADRGFVVEGGGIAAQYSPQKLLSIEEGHRFVKRPES